MTPQNNIEQQFQEEDSSFDIMHWVSLGLHYWYLFVIFTLLALGLAYLKNRSWMPAYQSVGKIMIDEYGASPGAQAIMQGFGLQASYRNINNQVIMLGSYDLLCKVVDSMPDLKIDYISKGRFKTHYLYKSSPIDIKADYLSPEIYDYMFKLTSNPDGSYTIVSVENEDKTFSELKATGRFGEPLLHNAFFITVNKNRDFNENQSIFFRFRSRESLVDEFSPRLNFSFVNEGASVLDISLVSQTPERDVDFINKLSEMFLAQNLVKKNDAARKTIQFIDQQLLSVSESLSKSEDRMTRFRQANQIVDVSSYTKDLLSKVTEIDKKQGDFNLKKEYLKHLESYLSTNMEQGAVLAPSSIGLNEPVLMQLVQQINDLQARRSALTPNNPYFAQYSQQIDLLKTSIRETIKSMHASLMIQENDIKARNKEVEIEIAKLPNKELEMISIERKYRVDDNYYTFFLQKRAEAEIQEASNTPDNEILDKARTISITNLNARSKTLTIYLLMGLMIACLIIFLRELFNNTIRSVKDIEKNSSYPVIGSIRHTRSTDPALVVKKPRSSFAEMFRVIRTRIEFIAQRKTNIMISITSTESADGKTYFATNLAAIYAMTKKKVILMDVDIRKPSVLNAFGKTARYGLTNYLIDECSLEDAIVRVEGVDYDILPGGTIPPNPGEIIRSDKLKELLYELRKVYDYIIMDTSPIGLVADAYSLVSVADVNLFIVRSERTHRAFFKKLMQQLEADKVQKLYIVFNDVQDNTNRYGTRNAYTYGRYSYAAKIRKKDKDKLSQYYQDDDDI